MKKFIQKLRDKPENERKRILLLTSAVITVLIFIFWIVSFRHVVMTENHQNKKTVEVTPLSVLKDNLSNAYQSFHSTDATTSSSTIATSTATSTGE